MKINLDKIAKSLYPNSWSCSHEESYLSLETEVNDDRFDYVMVVRCENCEWPILSREATEEEIARKNESSRTI